MRVGVLARGAGPHLWRTPLGADVFGNAKAGVVAEFFDGTDTVTLKWLGRNRIRHRTRRKLWVSGRVLSTTAPR